MLSKASEKYKNLPARYKAMYLGITVSSVSLFMPWYSDVDAFNAGASYLGITGPTAMMGVSLLILNVITIGLITFKFRFKREAKLPMSRRVLEKLHGPAYLYMVFLMMSVYFSDDFGINLANKTAGFGVYIGGTGAFISTIGGLRKQKEIEEVLPEIVEDIVSENTDATREMWAEQQEIARKLEQRQRQPITPPSTDQVYSDHLHEQNPETKVNENHMIRPGL